MITGVLLRVLLILLILETLHENQLNRYVSDDRSILAHKISTTYFVYMFEQVENHPDGVRLIHLLSIGFEHSGEIKCTAAGSDEHTSSIASYSNLVVLPLTKHPQNGTTSTSANRNLCRNELEQSPVHISKGPEDCVALIGGNVTLKVHYIGVPRPLVKWLLAVSKHSLFLLVLRYVLCAYMRIIWQLQPN